MNTTLSNPFLMICLTLGVFFMAKQLQKKTGLVLLNPLLLTMAFLIILLRVCGISYESYNEGGRYISFWLKPAVVALGVPLYLQLESIKKQLLPIMLSQVAGCILGVVSVVVVARLFEATPEIIASLAPKSVTTPIAMEVSEATGGIPSLTASVVVCTGVLGAVLGFQVMKLFGIRSLIAQGLAIGTASHALGTSAAVSYSRRLGSYASIGLTLNGVLTAIFTPHILGWFSLI